MVYIFLMGVAFVALVVYGVIVFQEAPELAAERLGELEPLPEDLGRWVTDETSPAAQAAAKDGLRREVRHLHEEGGLMSSNVFITQIRYKDESGAIVRVEPEQRTTRKRVLKKRA